MGRCDNPTIDFPRSNLDTRFTIPAHMQGPSYKLLFPCIQSSLARLVADSRCDFSNIHFIYVYNVHFIFSVRYLVRQITLGLYTLSSRSPNYSMPIMPTYPKSLNARLANVRGNVAQRPRTWNESDGPPLQIPNTGHVKRRGRYGDDSRKISYPSFAT